MNLRRVAIACAAPVAMSFMMLSAPASAQTSSLSPEFERAMLDELDDATSAEVQKRATGGNTVSGVIATMLLNNYQKSGPGQPGQALSVVAVDFSRGVVVLRRGPNQFEVQRFDPKTLRIQR